MSYERIQEKPEEAFWIKQAYQNGEISLEFANAQMKAHVGTFTPAELAYIEQNMQEKVDDECIKEGLSEMLAIYDGVLLEDCLKKLQASHPIRNYLEENQAIKEVIATIENLLDNNYIKNQWYEAFEKLNQFKIHLNRKQNQLYPYLEHKGFDRPTETMWLYDNQIRDKISELTTLAQAEKVRSQIKKAFNQFKEMILDPHGKRRNGALPNSSRIDKRY